MNDGTTVVGICGSLRDESRTRVVLEHALRESRRAGASVELIDLREYDLPLFDADEREAGDAPRLAERVEAADAILLATPMYHGSYSSPLKTAIDYCGFDEFEHKTVGLLAVSGGGFPLTALDHLRSVCRALNAWVLPYQAAVPNSSRRIQGGEIVDEDVADRVATLGERVVRYANIEPDPPYFESEQNVGARDED